MRIIRPLRGPLLFEYPAVNAFRYDWAMRPAGQRIGIQIVTAAWIGSFLLIWLAMVGHSQPVVQWLRFWPAALMLSCLVFILNLYINRNRNLKTSHRHSFFANSAVVYTGKGKRGFVTLFPDRARSLNHQEIFFRGDRFHLFTARFKDTVKEWLPDRTVVRFGIPVECDLTEFQGWLAAHGLTLTIEATLKRDAATSKYP
jgi:hypothetical protein